MSDIVDIHFNARFRQYLDDAVFYYLGGFQAFRVLGDLGSQVFRVLGF